MYVDVAVNQPIKPLTYSINVRDFSDISIGGLVRVSIRKKVVFGVVVDLYRQKKFDHKVIEVTEVIQKNWASQSTLRLAYKLSVWTGQSVGICLFRLIPPPGKKHIYSASLAGSEGPFEQQRIHIVGDLKWRIEHYLKLVERAGSMGRQIIIITPKGNFRDFESVLGQLPEVVFVDGSLSPTKQRQIARDFDRGVTKILVGSRHVIGWPANNLGLIIVDDVLNYAHSDDQRPYADSATIAWLRSQLQRIHLIFGCAAASPAMVLAEVTGQAKRIASSHSLTNVTFSDLSKSPSRTLGYSATSLIEKNLDANRSVAIIAPQLGVGGVLTCKVCAWTLYCPECEQKTAINLQSGLGKCFSCQNEFKLPTHCPECKGVNFSLFGMGTELVKKECARLFGEKINRLVVDTEGVLETGEFDAVIFVFPDSTLASPDLDRPFRLIGLIKEVSAKSTSVIIQTSNPDNVYWKLLGSDWRSAMKEILKTRQSLQLPPFARKISIKNLPNNIDIKNFPGVTSVVQADTIELTVDLEQYQNVVSQLSENSARSISFRTDSILQTPVNM